MYLHNVGVERGAFCVGTMVADAAHSVSWISVFQPAFIRIAETESTFSFRSKSNTVKHELCAALTVGAGLKLHTGAAGSVSSSSSSSDLQEVCSVGLQAIQSHVTTTGTENGVAGLLLLLEDKTDAERK